MSATFAYYTRLTAVLGSTAKQLLNCVKDPTNESQGEPQLKVAYAVATLFGGWWANKCVTYYSSGLSISNGVVVSIIGVGMSNEKCLEKLSSFLRVFLRVDDRLRPLRPSISREIFKAMGQTMLRTGIILTGVAAFHRVVNDFS